MTDNTATAPDPQLEIPVGMRLTFWISLGAAWGIAGHFTVDMSLWALLLAIFVAVVIHGLLMRVYLALNGLPTSLDRITKWSLNSGMILSYVLSGACCILMRGILGG